MSDEVNEVKKARDAAKARYQGYRDAAARSARRLKDKRVTIPVHATVQEVGDGAFVEAIMWVPRSALKGL
jgi:hypothetical protein